jgi:hypothetical protein
MTKYSIRMGHIIITMIKARESTHGGQIHETLENFHFGAEIAFRTSRLTRRTLQKSVT